MFDGQGSRAKLESVEGGVESGDLEDNASCTAVGRSGCLHHSPAHFDVGTERPWSDT